MEIKTTNGHARTRFWLSSNQCEVAASNPDTYRIRRIYQIGYNLGVADSTFAEHAGEARLGETVPLVGDDTQVSGVVLAEAASVEPEDRTLAASDCPEWQR
jgi:Domain of unknown function (DUF3883)